MSSGWKNASTSDPCPVCSKADWCRRSEDGGIVDCYREGATGSIERTDKSGGSYWRHYTRPRQPGMSGHEYRAAREAAEEDAGAPPMIAFGHDAAAAEVRGEVYQALVEVLKLYDDHAESLRSKRGLMPEEALALGYRSFPDAGLAREAVEHLVRRFGETTLLSVPGFDRVYRDIPLSDGTCPTTSEIRLSGSRGVLLPVRNAEHLITGMTMRLDDPAQPDPSKTYLRYLPLSSRTPTGCKAVIETHYPIHTGELRGRTVRYIEGVIKADLCTLRTGVLTIGIPSGGKWVAGAKSAIRLGASELRLAPDADTRTNKGICSTFVRAVDLLAANSANVCIETWPPSAGKGLDDVLHAGGEAAPLSGLAIWKTLEAWLASAGCEPHPRVRARIVLDGLVERVKADPSYAFGPDIAESVAALDATTPEYQRLRATLMGLLGTMWDDFKHRLAGAQKTRAKGERVGQLKEIVAQGGKVFKLGDHVEASRHLLADVTERDVTRAVFDRGALFIYQDGIYKQVPEAELIARVAGYSGSPLVTGGVLKVSSGYCKGAVELTSAQCARPGFFDEAPPGVAFANGFLLVDATAGSARVVPASRDHRVRVQYGFDYVAGETPARFLAALERYFRSDADKAEKVSCLQEFFGAAIVGAAPALQKAVILRGTAGNDGKSTLGQILAKAMPPGSVSSVSPQKLDSEYSRAALDGALLNLVFEVPEMDVVDAAPLKAVIVGDSIEARHPYQRPFSLKSRAANLYICNRFFRVKDPDAPFRRRWIIIEFHDPLTTEEINASFVADIVATELPAIVSWAIDGLIRRLRTKEYTTPRSSAAALNDWIKEFDTLGAFLGECAVVLDAPDRVDRKAWTKASVLYAEYSSWAKESGHPPMSSTTLGTRLKARLNLKAQDVERSDGNYYPVRLLSVQRVAVGGPDDANVTSADVERSLGLALSAAIVAGSAVTATLTVSSAADRAELGWVVTDAQDRADGRWLLLVAPLAHPVQRIWVPDPGTVDGIPLRAGSILHGLAVSAPDGSPTVRITARTEGT